MQTQTTSILLSAALLIAVPSAASAMQEADPTGDTVGTVCYKDMDGDGHGAGKSVSVSQATACSGSMSELGDDCNDKDASAWETMPCYTDTDRDGYGTGSAQSLCAGTCPDGMAQVPNDCDDTSAAVGQSNQWCYTDNDRDGLGGSRAAPNCGTCAAPRVKNNSDCTDLAYCFERTGKLDLTVKTFELTFTGSDGETDSFKAGASALANSRVVGQVARDGTLSIPSADFKVVDQFTYDPSESNVASALTSSDVLVTVSLTARSNISTKITPSSGQIQSLPVDLAMTFALSYTDNGGKQQEFSCMEPSMPIELYTQKSYDSRTGAMTLASKPFTIDKTDSTKPQGSKGTNAAVCTALNTVGKLPATAELVIEVSAKQPPFPVSSWPEI